MRKLGADPVLTPISPSSSTFSLVPKNTETVPPLRTDSDSFGHERNTGAAKPLMGANPSSVLVV